MSLSMSNGYLTSLLGQFVATPGLVLGLTGGSPAPVSADAPNPIGVSLGPSGQIATPGTIAMCAIQTAGSLPAVDTVLCLPLGITTGYALEPGRLVPLADVQSGTPIPYALALESASSSTVRALLSAAISQAAAPGTSPIPVVTYGVTTVTAPDAVGVMNVPVDGRVFTGSGFLHAWWTPILAGETVNFVVRHQPSGLVLFSAAYTDADVGVVDILFPTPTLIDGEMLEIVQGSAVTNKEVSITYQRYNNAINPPVAASLRAIIPIGAPLLFAGPPLIGPEINWGPWAPNYAWRYDESELGFSSVGLGLLVCNPDSVPHDVVIVNDTSGSIDSWTSALAARTFRVYPLPFLKRNTNLSLSSGTAVTDHPPVAFGVFAQYNQLIG